MIEVLHRNDQWMVIEDDGKIFLAESRSGDPEDAVIGFAILAKDLETLRDGTYSEIEHVCEKSWVSIDLFEEAVMAAVHWGLMHPTYDLEAWFLRCKLEKLRRQGLTAIRAMRAVESRQ